MEVDEHFYLCWSDITKALKARWWLIRLCMCTAATLFFSYALFKSPTFVTQAVFQEKSKSASPIMGSGGLSQLTSLLGASGSSVEQVLSCMESRRLGERVISHTGLQITERPPGRTLRLLKNLKDNLITEFAALTERPSAATEARMPRVVFRNVDYSSLYSHFFSLTFGENGSFVYEDGVERCSGQVGLPLNTHALRLTVESSSGAAVGKRVNFIASPMYKSHAKFKRALKVKKGKRKDGTIEVSYSHASPRQAMDVANALMNEYLAMIKSDAREMTDEQLQFLASAQEKVWANIGAKFKKHADIAKESIAVGGYARTQDALQMNLEGYGKIKARLHELHQESAALKGADLALISTNNRARDAQLMELNQRLHELNTRKNALEVALGVEKDDFTRVHVEALEKESQVRQGLRQMLADNTHAALVSDGKNQLPRAYVKALISASALRSRIHEASMGCASPAPAELQGMGLDQATAHYDSSLNFLRELETKEASLKEAIAQLERGDFNMGALLDTIGIGESFHQMARECHELQKSVLETKSYSLKEQERMREQVAFQKDALKKHLMGVQGVNQDQQISVKQRIKSAQKALLSLVCKETALVREEMSRGLDQRRLDIEKEVAGCKSALESFRAEMAQLPDALMEEKKLDLETKFQSELMRRLGSLAESRQVAANLDIIESKPLDHALLPIRPKSPGLILWGLVGGGLGLCFGALYTLGSASLQGFVATRDNLLVRSQFVAGDFREVKGADEVRLRALLYAHKGVILSIGSDSNELNHLARCLAEQGNSVGVISREALSASEYFECHLLKRFNCATVSAQLSELEGKYDALIIHIPEKALSPLALNFSCMKSEVGAVVYLEDEKVGALSPYFEWSKRASIAFVLR